MNVFFFLICLDLCPTTTFSQHLADFFSAVQKGVKLMQHSFGHLFMLYTELLTK